MEVPADAGRPQKRKGRNLGWLSDRPEAGGEMICARHGLFWQRNWGQGNGVMEGLSGLELQRISRGEGKSLVTSTPTSGWVISRFRCQSAIGLGG